VSPCGALTKLSHGVGSGLWMTDVDPSHLSKVITKLYYLKGCELALKVDNVANKQLITTKGLLLTESDDGNIVR
jgi:hypothetical protein